MFFPLNIPEKTISIFQKKRCDVATKLKFHFAMLLDGLFNVYLFKDEVVMDRF